MLSVPNVRRVRTSICQKYTAQAVEVRKQSRNCLTPGGLMADGHNVTGRSKGDDSLHLTDQSHSSLIIERTFFLETFARVEENCADEERLDEILVEHLPDLGAGRVEDISLYLGLRCDKLVVVADLLASKTPRETSEAGRST